MAIEDDQTSPLLRAIGGLLRPLARILIARGVTFPILVRMLKVAYVDSARRDFRIGDAPPTDSRVSVLTGVHRRDVRELKSVGEDDPSGGVRATTVLATVVGRWLASAETTDEAGKPRPLPRTAPEGPSFERLMKAVNTDVRPRTVLDELIRLGVVVETNDGFLALSGDAVLGPSDADQMVLYFAANVGDHLAAAAENLLDPDVVHLERAVFYNRLTDADVAELNALSAKLGQELLLTVNREAHRRQTVSADRQDGTRRFRLGLYVYSRDMQAEDADDVTPDDRTDG